MKIFISGTSFQAAHGGPAVSVARLAGALARAGAEVGLWAPDQSSIDASVLPGAALVPGARVRRLGGAPARALDNFGAPDVIHDNGMWLAHNHALAQLAARRAIPRVVSTRGMLEPWALAHKRWKKRLAFALYQRRDLARALCHHVTADTEAGHLRALRLRVPIAVIPNGVDVPPQPDAAQRPRPSDRAKAPRTALFIGRICPVKGLPMLVEAWARVRPHGWLLSIAGPDEAGHQAEVARAVAERGLGDVVSFAGPLYGARKQAALFDADLLVLPSYSESFGMAAAEALAHGVPVLTTTGTPWAALPQRGCGWWVDATLEAVAEGLRQATAQTPELLRAMGECGREWVATAYGWDEVARRFLALYRDAVHGSGAPAKSRLCNSADKSDAGA